MSLTVHAPLVAFGARSTKHTSTSEWSHEKHRPFAPRASAVSTVDAFIAA